ncbi:nitrate reductase molybdenum cofactor assembly chaperone [Streptomyces sp. CA-253872]|uniref:nitrate reductase molybdenum cofactor assembly chaperone n=1 Tax=Streptomyces sp. CA-253872 TaxID=3240067 RepID=UPI003D917CF0
MRGEGAALSITKERAALVHQAAALCLLYPDDRLPHRLGLVEAVRLGAPGIDAFTAWARATEAGELAAHYVAVFDFKNRHSLYLSWWRDGDTRRRGTTLVAFKEAYRAHGFECTDEELPDFLPAVLEFSAQAGPALLLEHRPGLELLRLSLAAHGTPYAGVLEAVCATLPGPSPADLAEARRMARVGPPREAVGLDGYGGTGATSPAAFGPPGAFGPPAGPPGAFGPPVGARTPLPLLSEDRPEEGTP